MKSERVTITDIADMCDVSTATVSRALNDKRGVGKALRQKIVDCARRNEYVPDPTAQSLRSRRSNRAYVILRSEINGEIPFPFPSNDALREATGMDTYVHVIPYEKDLIADLQTLRDDYSPKLFVIVGPCLVSDTSRFRSLRTRLLFVLCNDAPPGYPSVRSDDLQGSMMVTSSLIEAGHTRIEVLTDSFGTRSNYSRRVEGYRQALDRHGITFDPSLVHSIPVDFGRYFSSSEKQLTTRIVPLLNSQSYMLRNPPTAVFVLSDFLAFTLVRVLQNAGIHVPYKLSVASFGGWPVTQYIPVSIQTWVQPSNDIVTATLTAMSSLLNSEDFPQSLSLPTRRPDGSYGCAHADGPMHYIVPGYLRTGESVSPPPPPQE
ncbi:MAG: LacI family DNA-binding transcriptional regulator [Bifidobacterium sp.]|jgi:DNA-binding LacI/PurR family transcriptional regulator